MGNQLCCATPSDGQQTIRPKTLMKKYAMLPCMGEEQWQIIDKLNVIKEFGLETPQWLRIPETQLEKLFAVELIIYLLEKANGYKINTEVPLRREFVRFLITEAKLIFIKHEKSLLEVEAPVCITGDFHGQFYDLLRLMDIVGGAPPKKKFIVMGDFVDRGKQSLETICLLLAYKIRYPDKMYLIRGNHESSEITRVYGFYDECKRKQSIAIYRQFIDLFNHLPVAAIVNDRIFCVHGGLSPQLNDLQHINKDIIRPLDVPNTGLLCDLLWADPRDDDLQGFDFNEARGISKIFGTNEVKQFCDKHDLDLICRAHQVMEDGFEFFADRQMVTVFSAPNYMGEFDNCGAIIEVNEDLQAKFHKFNPNKQTKR